MQDGVQEYLEPFYPNEVCRCVSLSQCRIHRVLQGDIEKLAAALPRACPISLRVNTLKLTAAELTEHVREHIAKLDHPQAVRMASLVATHPVLPDVVMLQPVTSDTAVEPHTVEPGTAHVWVDRFCGEAILKGASIFAAGVCAMSEHCAVGNRVSVFVDVEAP